MFKYSDISIRFNQSDYNEAILTWGDTAGVVNALHFHASMISLFERPTTTSNDKQGRTLLKHIFTFSI